MKFLKNHPFAVKAFFESSTVLTFAVPKEELEKFVPHNLSLDTFNNEWAFIAIALVKTSQLRPKGFPKFLGQNFYLIGYRIFARYTNKAGKRLRGLYIIKSETNKKKMEWIGNVFTHYNYTTTDISETILGQKKTIQSKTSDFKIDIDLSNLDFEIPQKSPFKEWKDARKFAGPLPFTFQVNEEKKEVLIIQGVRQNWKPSPITIKGYHFRFLNNLNFKNLVLANAFEIKQVPYHWKKGKIEKWN